MDCPEMDDEQTCPPEFTFDTCSNLNDCYWHEDTPDDLDFSVMKGTLNSRIDVTAE